MTDPNRNSGTPRDAADDVRPHTPLWAKVFGIVLMLVVLFFVALHLAGRGFHGH